MLSWFSPPTSLFLPDCLTFSFATKPINLPICTFLIFSFYLITMKSCFSTDNPWGSWILIHPTCLEIFSQMFLSLKLSMTFCLLIPYWHSIMFSSSPQYLKIPSIDIKSLFLSSTFLRQTFRKFSWYSLFLLSFSSFLYLINWILSSPWFLLTIPPNSSLVLYLLTIFGLLIIWLL